MAPLNPNASQSSFPPIGQTNGKQPLGAVEARLAHERPTSPWLQEEPCEPAATLAAVPPCLPATGSARKVGSGRMSWRPAVLLRSLSSPSPSLSPDEAPPSLTKLRLSCEQTIGATSCGLHERQMDPIEPSHQMDLLSSIDIQHSAGCAADNNKAPSL